ncbi:MAG TPA: sigma-70 family RNA polymerase sigma factor [Polyangiaceae bacterium]|nr:sigma-70 family RNA polymerase sigma factor [Polyangiaceae bacterium]
MSRSSGIADRPPRVMCVVTAGDASAEDDAAIVAAVRARLPRAAGRLWDRHSEMVRRILRRILGPSADVEDAVQDAFLRLFRDLESLRDPSALRGFLIGITLHVAKAELRRRRAKRWLLLSSDGVLAEPEPHEGAPYVEQRAALVRLYRVLDRLGSDSRSVFVLRYVEGLDLTELSAVLGCSLSTTKRRVADAARRVCLLAAGDPLLAPYVAGPP